MNILLGGTYGLGAEVADRLRDDDQDVFIVGRSFSEAKHGAGMAVDLSRPDSANRLVDCIQSQVGKSALEGFYWLAGHGYTGNFSDQTDGREMMLSNFTNVIPIAQAAWNAMAAQDHGNFVVVSSTTGIRARSNEAVYSASKHAQVGFTRSLGLEAERLQSNVHVSLFMPGGMRTPFWDGKRPENYGTFLDAKKVAHRIVAGVKGQKSNFYEEIIERGSL